MSKVVKNKVADVVTYDPTKTDSAELSVYHSAPNCMCELRFNTPFKFEYLISNQEVVLYMPRNDLYDVAVVLMDALREAVL